MLLASLMFAAMGALIKLASPAQSLGQIVLFRGMPSLALLGLWIFLSKKTLFNSNALLHLRRNGFGMIAMWSGFYALQHLPLATATTLNYTSPLFIAVILVCFMGRTTQRSLGAQGEPEWRTVFFFSLASTLTGALACLFQGLEVLPQSTGALALLLGIGLTGAAGQLAMTRAFSRGSTWLSASLQYATVLFSVLLGETIWHERIDPLAFAGICLIILCGTLSSWVTAKKKPEPEAY
ncbi:MAG: EamA family transporter [Burkholderiales bacterium]|nr:EamA family transporter [Burkholderiales bacterium]